MTFQKTTEYTTMRILFIFLISLGSLNVVGQNKEDSKIIVTVNDSSNLYDKVKYALVNCDFIVKDNGNRDTLTTYIREYSKLYCMARAIIKGNTITLTSIYGLKRVDDWGYTQTPKNYSQTIYYKGSKCWKLLMQVTSKIGSEFNYSK